MIRQVRRKDLIGWDFRLIEAFVIHGYAKADFGSDEYSRTAILQTEQQELLLPESEKQIDGCYYLIKLSDG